MVRSHEIITAVSNNSKTLLTCLSILVVPRLLQLSLGLVLFCRFRASLLSLTPSQVIRNDGQGNAEKAKSIWS